MRFFLKKQKTKKVQLFKALIASGKQNWVGTTLCESQVPPKPWGTLIPWATRPEVLLCLSEVSGCWVAVGKGRCSAEDASYRVSPLWGSSIALVKPVKLALSPSVGVFIHHTILGKRSSVEMVDFPNPAALWWQGALKQHSEAAPVCSSLEPLCSFLSSQTAGPWPHWFPGKGYGQKRVACVFVYTSVCAYCLW